MALGDLLVHVLPGSQVSPAAPWLCSGHPGWGGSGWPGQSVLWLLSRLLVEAELLLYGEAMVSGLPST